MLIKLHNVRGPVEPREPAPTTVSVAIMAGNEREFIGDAIRSASWADEIVLLDTGSTDGTDAIAESMGVKVTREPWRTVDLGDGLRCIDDFGGARTRAIELASCEWVAVLDADERFVHGENVRAILEGLPACVDFADMRLEHDGRPELEQPMTCIFRRSARPVYEHSIHETLTTWAATRTMASIPRDAAYRRHLGADRGLRARLRRDDRNWRLIQRALARNPDDTHALAYAIEMMDEFGRADVAERLARHAYMIVSPTSPERLRVLGAACEFLHRRGDAAAVVEIVEDARGKWVHDAGLNAFYGLSLWLAGRHDEARGPLEAAAREQDKLSTIMAAQVARALGECRHAA